MFGGSIVTAAVKILLGVLATVLLSLGLSAADVPGIGCARLAAARRGGSSDDVAAVRACQRDVDAAAQRGTIVFARGGAAVANGASPVLDAIAAALVSCPRVRVEVGGHTDLRGPAAANQSLSQQRARAVVSALEQRGVPPERLTARGYGATHPVVEAIGRDADARNRRTTFIVTPSAARQELR